MVGVDCSECYIGEPMAESYDDRKMRLMCERIIELEYAVDELARLFASAYQGIFNVESDLLKIALNDEDEETECQ